MTLPAPVLFVGLSRYELGNLVAHLIAGAMFTDLRRLLTLDSEGTNAWEAVRASRGELDGYLRELHEVDLAVAEGETSSAVVSRCLYNLMACSSLNANSHLPGDFLLALVAEGVWPLSQALRLVGQGKDEPALARTTEVLATRLDPDVAEELAVQAHAFRDSRSAIRVLSMLMPHLSEASRGGAVEEIVMRFESLGEEARAAPSRTAVHLAGHPHASILFAETLPAYAHMVPAGRLAEVIGACEMLQADDALATLALHVPAGRIDEVIEAARRLKGHGVVALSAAAARLPDKPGGSIRDEAIREARALRPDSERGAALGAIAAHVAQPLQGQLLTEALAGVAAAGDASIVQWAASWAKSLPPESSGTVLRAALDAALRLDDEDEDEDLPFTRADALVLLSQVLPPFLLEEALAAGWKLPRAYDRLRATAAVTQHLPPAQRPGVAERVADLARAEWSQWWGADTLLALAPFLQQEPEATLNEVRGHVGKWNSSYVALAGQLPRPVWREFLVSALESMRELDDLPAQARLIADLSQHVDAPRREHLAGVALQGLHAIDRADERISVAAGIAPRLSTGRERALLEEAATWVGEIPRFWGTYAHEAARTLVPMLVEHRLLPGAWRVVDDLRTFDEDTPLTLLTMLTPYSDVEQVRVLKGRCHASPASLATVEAMAAIAKRSDQSPVIWEETLDIVDQLPCGQAFVDGEAAGALHLLAPCLPVDLLPRAVVVARRLEDGQHRASGLAAIAGRLDPASRQRLLDEALDAARSSSLTVRRGRFLAALLPYLSEPRRTEVAREALEVLRQDDFPGQRLGALISVAPYLPAADVLPTLRHDLFHRNRTHGGLPAIAAGARLLPAAEQPQLAAELATFATGMLDVSNPAKYRQELLSCAADIFASSHAIESNRDVVLKLLPMLTSYPRSEFLDYLRALLPCLVLGDQGAATEMADAVADVCTWWP